MKETGIIEFRVLSEPDNRILDQICAIERQAFGDGGIDRWVLSPFIRHCKVSVLIHDGRVLGVAEWIRNFDNPKVVYLFGLAIDYEYRGNGLGRRLLSESIKLWRMYDITTVRLTVAEDNLAAVGLYESMGFHVEANLADEYGKGEDRLLMTAAIKVMGD